MQDIQAKPVVSIIINCFNGQQYLRQAIDSVLSQTYKNWEIIFWDNASTDKSPDIVKEYGNKKIHYFKSEKTCSLGEARNLALKNADGKYIAFLDCDDIWLPEKLEKQISIFSKDPDIGLVFSDALYFNDKGKSFRLYGKKKPPEGYVFRQLLTKNFLCLSSVMMKKEALLNLAGWFDARFSCIEDMDLFLRIAHDWKLSCADGVLIKYRMHQKSWTYTHQSSFPEEQELLIEKLSSLYSNLSQEYRDELRAIQMRIGYEKFALFWKAHDEKRARRELRPFLLADKRLFLPYLISYFLPFVFFGFLIGIFREKTYSA